MGNHDDAEDLTQEVCFRCLLRQATFRGKAEFAAWLYRVKVNVFRDYRRKKGRREESVEAEIGEEAFQAAHDAAQAWAHAAREAAQALVERVRAALSRLTPRQRQLLEWKYVEGSLHAEIAQRLGIKEQSARAALHRAVEAFIQAYEALDKDNG